ncbi:hypothetical protein [Amycolatopsis sp. MEPSY49]|uniref:hypothetical protein n=1 Tax=Amycolatopsis sp. MEPSY49 TaxID=3151600 RepID=UPI003EF317DC
MIDGGIVAAYAGAAFARGVARFADSKIDELLKAIALRVTAKLGRRAEEDLSRAPTDRAVQERVARAVENLAAADQRFARELDALVRRLDQAGGRRIINQVVAETNAQHFGQGNIEVATHGGLISKVHAPSPANYSGAPAWVRVAVWLGALLAVGGFGLTVVEVATVMSTRTDEFGRPAFPAFADIRLGVVLFGLGLVLSLVASLGRATSRRGW